MMEYQIENQGDVRQDEAKQATGQVELYYSVLVVLPTQKFLKRAFAWLSYNL